MGVFELRDGRLVATPESAASDVDAAVLHAVRAQSLELIDRPLFPVGWVGSEHESMLALDPTGQVVTVDVIAYLTAQSFVTALTRAGRHADMKRGALADLYAGGARAFCEDYQNFLDASPPQTKRGPRLFIFAVDSDSDVRRPLAALRGGGVETYRIVIHDGANGPLIEISGSFEPRAVIDAGAERAAIEHAVDTSEAREAEDAEAGSTEPRPAGSRPAEPRPAAPGGREFSETPGAAEWEGGKSELAEPAPAKPVHVDSERAQATLTDPVRVESEMAVFAPADSGSSEADDELVSTAMGVDEAWEITGWKHEKQRPERRDEEELRGLAEVRKNERARRAAEQHEVLERLARERKDIGTTLFEQVKAAARRAEQQLWDMSAPKHESDAQIFSERFSSEASSDAVANAALRSDRWDEKSKQASPVRRHTSPAREQANPVREQASPVREQVSPAREQTSHVNEQVGSPREQASPAREGVSHPAGEELTPNPRLAPNPRLERVVQELGAVELVLTSRRRRSSISGQLTGRALIRIAGVGTFADPTDAARAASGNPYIDGWRGWHVPDGRALHDFS